MGENIELEWDEAKRQKTLKERNLDFKLAQQILEDPNFVYRIDERKDYKETRYISYGKVIDEVYCLCYTMRGNVYRVISLRRTHEKEREKYYGKDSKNESVGNS